MRRFLLALGLASLAITLALVAGAQLPDGALPVVLGVLAGIAASLPTSLIIVWRVSRALPPPTPGAAPAAPERPPTVIVVPPAPPAAGVPPTPPPATPPAAHAGLVHETRASTIIGGHDDAGA